MPVYKYRSPGDMPPPGGNDAALASRIRALWTRAFLFCPPVLRRGVKRFRSIEEANDERQRATLERMKSLAKNP